MIWLLRLDWLGRTWYLASRSCAPVDDGTARPHTGTLTCDGFAEAIDLGGGITGPCAADVTFVLPGIDVRRMVLDGHQLATMRGELSMWSPEQTYAQRYVLLRGDIKAGIAPGLGEAVEGTLTQVILENADSYPPEDATATLSTWAAIPDADESTDSEGAPYPFPLGNLGTYDRSDGTTTNAAAGSAIIVDGTGAAEVALVAGAPIAAAAVTLYEAEDKTSATFAVTTSTDLLGRVCSVVDLSGAPVAWVLDGTVDLYIASMQGGIAKSHGSGAITGLGDAVLHLLLQRYSEDGTEIVDVGRWLAAMPWLNAWEVGFVVEAGDDPLDVIADRLCSMCPALWIMPGPAGVRPVILADTDPTGALHLEIGRNCDETPDSELGELEIDPVTSCTVSYAESVRLNKFRAAVTIDRLSDLRAATGYTRHGSRALALEIASYSRSTAALTASEYIRLGWTPPQYFSALVPAHVALSGSCDLGAKVRYTCAADDIDERPLYVQGRQTDADGEHWTVTLVGWW